MIAIRHRSSSSRPTTRSPTASARWAPPSKAQGNCSHSSTEPNAQTTLRNVLREAGIRAEPVEAGCTACRQTRESDRGTHPLAPPRRADAHIGAPGPPVAFLIGFGGGVVLTTAARRATHGIRLPALPAGVARCRHAGLTGRHWLPRLLQRSRTRDRRLGYSGHRLRDGAGPSARPTTAHLSQPGRAVGHVRGASQDHRRSDAAARQQQRGRCRHHRGADTAPASR